MLFSENPTTRCTPIIDDDGFIQFDFNNPKLTRDDKLYMCEQMAYLATFHLDETFVQEVLKTGKTRFKVILEGESTLGHDTGTYVPASALDVPTRQALHGKVYGEIKTVLPDYDDDYQKVGLDTKRAMRWVAGSYQWRAGVRGWTPRKFEQFLPEKVERYIDVEDRLRTGLGLKGFKEKELEAQKKTVSKKKSSETSTKQETAEEKQRREACVEEVKQAGSSGSAQGLVDRHMRVLEECTKKLVQYGNAIRDQYDSASTAGLASAIIERVAGALYSDEGDREALKAAVRQIDKMRSERLKKQADAEKRAKTSAKPAAEQKATKPAVKPTQKPTTKPAQTAEPATVQKKPSTPAANSDPHINLYSALTVVSENTGLSSEEKKIVLGLINHLLASGTKRLKLSVLQQKIKDAGADVDIIIASAKK